MIRINPRLFKKNSILTSWIISYLFIVLAITGISAVVYSFSQRIIRDEINRTNDILLRQLQQSLDIGLRDIDTLVSQVSLNDKLRMLITWDDARIESIRFKPDYYRVSETVSELKKFKSVNNYVAGMYIYLKNSGMILSLEGLLDTRTYYEAMQLRPEFREAESYEEWLGAIKLAYTRKFRVARNEDGSPLTYVDNIKLLQTIPLNASGGATLALVLDKERFMDSIKTVSEMYNGWAMIIDSEDQVLFSNMPDYEAWNPEYESLPGRTGLLSEEIHGKRYAVSYISSEKYEWKYITLIPYSLYQEKLRYAWNLMLGGLFISLITGTVLAIFFSSRNFNPVNELVYSIRDQIKNPDAEKENEFATITEAIRTTIDENETITRQLNQQNAVLKINFMERLLKGETEDKQSIEEAFKTYDIRFVSRYFAVILLHVTDCGAESQLAEDFRLARFILKNIAEELIMRDNAGFVLETGGTTTCIVNFKPENAAAGKRVIAGIINEACDFARKNFGMAVRTAAGSIRETVFGLPAAYKEACDLMEYKTLTENDAVLFFDEIKNPTYYYNYSFENEYQLINCIKTGDTIVSLKTMENIFSSLLSKDDLSVEYIKCIIFDLAGTVLRAISGMDPKLRESFLKEAGFPAGLLACETFSEMRQYMNRMIAEICSFVKGNKNGKANELADEVINIIEENYADSDLNVSVIAESLSISPSYLTKVFKDHTGKGVHEYISARRLNEAKRLLRDSGLTIKDISARAGYYNINAFNRMFKKSESITPSSYRENSV